MIREYIIKDWKISIIKKKYIYDISIQTKENKRLVYWEIINNGDKEFPNWEAIGYSGLGKLKRKVKWDSPSKDSKKLLSEILDYAVRLCKRIQEIKYNKNKAERKGITLYHKEKI